MFFIYSRKNRNYSGIFNSGFCFFLGYTRKDFLG